jgi:predicted flap endonuclease-1-like 5' DNA nuclease
LQRLTQKVISMQHLAPEQEDSIRARAYQYWLEEGRPEGRHEIHWQRALASLTPLSLVSETASAISSTVTDVSLIGGIGPKIKVQLANEGITTLGQIAALSAKALAKIDTSLGLKGRSAREDWIAQAKELVSGKAPRAKSDKVRAK